MFQSKLAAVVAGLMLCFPMYNFAQTQWEAQPKIHKIDEAHKKESIVFILDERLLQVKEDTKVESMFMHRSTHRIIKLLDDKGVESFNKMRIGSSRNGKILDIKARTIKADGKVFSLAMKDFKTSKDENGNPTYHIAFENVGIGDEIEYFYEEKRSLTAFGSEIMQFDIPVLKATFELSTPEHLKFDCKGYNGFPSAKETEKDSMRIYKSELVNIDGIKDEKYSDADLNAKRIDYKISYVTNKPSRLYTWNDLMGNVYELLYTYSDKETKAVQKFLKDLKITDNMSEEDKIKKIENAIKKEIVINDELQDPSYEKLDVVLDKKTTIEKGQFKLMVACFEQLGIKHEAGLTSNRFKYEVDEAFENWNYLDVYIIYFPKSKQYLLPTHVYMRYPALGAFVEGNKGVFCKRISAGGATSAVASIREVPLSTQAENYHDIFAEVNFASETLVPTIKIKHSVAGKSASGIREAITFSTKDKEKDLVKGIVSIADEESQIVKYSFNNKGLEHYSDNLPAEILADIKADNLMEKAGAKFLFKVGDLIGPQVEMYKAEKRVLPISIAYPHVMHREIVIHIPDGYKISNPEAADIKVFYADDTYGFVSNHRLEKNKLIINIKEHYGRVVYDQSEIEPFRNVINAAADFNKVTLVLEKI